MSDFLRRCSELSSPEEYQSLLRDLRATVFDADPDAVRSRLDDIDPYMQGLALLECAALGLPLAAKTLSAALATEHEPLTVAAAFYVSLLLADDLELQRMLLVGADAFTSPPVSRFGRSALVNCLGLSGRHGFREILFEILRGQYHFYNMRSVAEALDLLDVPVDPQKIPYSRSITVVGGHAGIFISTDDRFGGSSCCPSCDFFHCRINDFYTGAIEDCKLRNRIDPAGAGEILDRRDWGGDHKTEGIMIPDFTSRMREVGLLLDQGRFREAIPVLCSILFNASVRQQYVETPAAWIRLARCFAECGEEKLSFLAMREALAYGNILKDSYEEERAALNGFLNDPLARFGDDLGARGGVERPGLAAITYKEQDLYVAALDIYVDKNLLGRGESAGNWFEMGECHRVLGELAIASLFMNQAAKKTPDSELRARFEQGAEQTHAWATNAPDPGLDADRRFRERELVNLPKLLADPGLSRSAADDPVIESGYWSALLAEVGPESLARKMLGRLRPRTERELLDISSEWRERLLTRLLGAAREALESIHGLGARRRLGLPLPEEVERGLCALGRYAVAAAIYAAMHDNSLPEWRISSQDQSHGDPLFLACNRYLMLQNLKRDPTVSPDQSSLRDLAHDTLVLLDQVQSDDASYRESASQLREALETWLKEESLR